MSNGDPNWISNFIWGIADDVLRRLDALLEPIQQVACDHYSSSEVIDA